MNPIKTFKAWLRVSAEKVARRFYEGPATPPRLFDEIEIFEKLHPDASPEAWRTFVTGTVRNAYQDGYIRGYEHRERAPAGSPYEEQQAALLEAARHDWSPWRGQPTSAEMRRRFEEQRGDLLAHLSPEEREGVLDALGKHTGGYQIVWGDDPAMRGDREP